MKMKTKCVSAWAMLCIALIMAVGTAHGAASTENTLGRKATTDTTSQSGPLSFSEVVAVKDASASELYVRAKLWFSAVFVDSKNVLEVQDKEAGILMGKGSFQYEPNILLSSAAIRGHVTFSVTLMVSRPSYAHSGNRN